MKSTQFGGARVSLLPRAAGQSAANPLWALQQRLSRSKSQNWSEIVKFFRHMNSFWRADIECLALWSVSRELSSASADFLSQWKADDGVESHGADHLLHQRADRPFVSFILIDDTNDFNLGSSIKALAEADRAVEIVVAIEAERTDEIARLVSAIDPALPVRLVVCDDCQSVAEAENRALAIARGEFIAFLSPGDTLAPHALAVMRRVFERSPKLAVIYSDEDWIDQADKRRLPRFKTGWDPDAQLGHDLLGRLCLMRSADVFRVGGLRADHEPAHHYDLHCRLTDAISPSAIRHVPQLLYHRRIPVSKYLPEFEEARASYFAAARNVAQHAASRIAGSKVAVRASHLASFVNCVEWPVPHPAPLVSIVIPTRDKADLLRKCVESILSETDYAPFELLVLDNGSVESETAVLFDRLSLDSRIRILPVPGPFNYSEINNRGAAEARGEVLLFLNNDVEAISAGWLREMVGLALRGDVGCVGAKLLYPDERIQHAGVVLQEGPLAMHVFRLMNACDVGYDGQLAGVRTYSVVTAACMAVRKELFDRSGGFDGENLKVSFNDIDLCLRIEEMGYRNLCTPFATLLHFESASRGSEDTEEKIARNRRELGFLTSKWPDRFRLDSHHHPSLHFSWDGPISLAQGNRRFCNEAVVSR